MSFAETGGGYGSTELDLRITEKGRHAMATNLVALAMQYLTPDLIGRIATALGLNPTNAQTAIGAAVPALLAGFSGVAAQSGGAQKLVDAAKQQTGTLSSSESCRYADDCRPRKPRRRRWTLVQQAMVVLSMLVIGGIAEKDTDYNFGTTWWASSRAG
jgi:Bacterial protein of unknown function (DUF937)